MRLLFSIGVLCAFLTLPKASFADMAYYYRYVGSLPNTAKLYSDLKIKCKTDPSLEECVDLPVHARNLLLQKVTAYQELTDALVEVFSDTYPGLYEEQFSADIQKQNEQIADIKYLAEMVRPQNIPQLEKTMNALFTQNKELLDVLNMAIHLRKMQLVHKASNESYSNLATEVASAKKSGANVILAEKNLLVAKQNLDNAQKNIDKARTMSLGQESLEAPEGMQKQILIVYKDLDRANQNLLKTAETLLRLSEENYWDF